MSVIVKGMEMPNYCGKCPASYLNDGYKLRCNLLKRLVQENIIDPDCPLADVREDMDMVDLACWYDENILYPKRIEGKGVKHE